MNLAPSPYGGYGEGLKKTYARFMVHTRMSGRWCKVSHMIITETNRPKCGAIKFESVLRSTTTGSRIGILQAKHMRRPYSKKFWLDSGATCGKQDLARIPNTACWLRRIIRRSREASRWEMMQNSFVDSNSTGTQIGKNVLCGCWNFRFSADKIATWRILALSWRTSDFYWAIETKYLRQWTEEENLNCFLQAAIGTVHFERQLYSRRRKFHSTLLP